MVTEWHDFSKMDFGHANGHFSHDLNLLPLSLCDTPHYCTLKIKVRELFTPERASNHTYRLCLVLTVTSSGVRIEKKHSDWPWIRTHFQTGCIHLKKIWAPLLQSRPDELPCPLPITLSIKQLTDDVTPPVPSGVLRTYGTGVTKNRHFKVLQYFISPCCFCQARIPCCFLSIISNIRKVIQNKAVKKWRQIKLAIKKETGTAVIY